MDEPSDEEVEAAYRLLWSRKAWGLPDVRDALIAAAQVRAQTHVSDTERLDWFERNVSACRDIGWLGGPVRPAIDSAMLEATVTDVEKKARQIVNKAIDPWLNGDPCEDCADCEKVCRKLQDRLVSEIARALGGEGKANE